MTHLCNITWRSRAVPLDWQTGVVVTCVIQLQWDHTTQPPYEEKSMPGYWRQEFVHNSNLGFSDCHPGHRPLNQIFILMRKFKFEWGLESTCVLWDLTASLETLYGRCFGSMGHLAHYQRPFGPCATAARAWSVLLTIDSFPAGVGIMIMFIIF